MRPVIKETTKLDLLAFLSSAGLIHDPDDPISTDIVEKRVHDVFDYAQERNEILKTLRAGFNGAKLSYSRLTSLPFWNSKPECEGRVLLAVARDTWEERLGLGYMFQPKEGDRASPTSVFKEMRQTIDGIASALDFGICNVCLLDDDVKWAISLKVSFQTYSIDLCLSSGFRSFQFEWSSMATTTSPSSFSTIACSTGSKSRIATCSGSGAHSANALPKKKPKRPNAS